MSDTTDYIGEITNGYTDREFYTKLFGVAFSRLLGDPGYSKLLSLCRSMIRFDRGYTPERAAELLREMASGEIEELVRGFGGNISDMDMPPETVRKAEAVGGRLGEEVVPRRMVRVTYPDISMDMVVCDNEPSLVHASLVGDEGLTILTAEERILPEAVLLGADRTVRRMMREYPAVEECVDRMTDHYYYEKPDTEAPMRGRYCLRKHRYDLLRAMADKVRDKAAWLSFAGDYGEPEPEREKGDGSLLRDVFREVECEEAFCSDTEKEVHDSLRSLLDRGLLPGSDLCLRVGKTRSECGEGWISVSVNDPWNLVHDYIIACDGGVFSGCDAFAPVLERYRQLCTDEGLEAPEDGEVLATCYEMYLSDKIGDTACTVNVYGNSLPTSCRCTDYHEDTGNEYLEEVNDIEDAVCGSYIADEDEYPAEDAIYVCLMRLEIDDMTMDRMKAARFIRDRGLQVLSKEFFDRLIGCKWDPDSM